MDTPPLHDGTRRDSSGADPAPADLAIVALLHGGLAVQGLPLEETLRPRVLMHLKTALDLADLVVRFPLPDEAEPAPVYRP